MEGGRRGIERAGAGIGCWYQETGLEECGGERALSCQDRLCGRTWVAWEVVWVGGPLSHGIEPTAPTRGCFCLSEARRI